MKKNIFAAIFFALGLAVLPLSAEIMTYQGRLKESNLPVSDTRYFDFAFCNASNACTYTPSGIQPFTVVNGLFKSTFTVPGVTLSQGEWTLQVSIGPAAVSVQALSPRERLTAVPYSVYASSAGYASALAVNSGPGVISSTNVIVLGGLTASDTGLQVSTYAVIQGYTQLQNNNIGEQDVRVGVSGRVNSNSGEAGDIMAGGNFEAEVPTGKNGIMIGLRAATSNSGSSPRSIGLLVDSLQNSGTITDTYGLWIATLTQGTQPNKPYAVYSEDAGARTYFAGSVGIGTSAPAYALAVSSGAGEAGTIMAVSTGSTSLFWVTGDGAHATSFWGDGSGLTGVTGASGTDATKVLKAGDTMTGPLTAPDYAAIYGVTASSAVFSSGITASSYTATGDGLSAAKVLLAENVAISSEASSALGSGVRVSTNLYIVGFSSAARYYGDGSGLTGVTAGAVSGILPLASGGTGASNSDNARINLNAVSLAGDTMTGALNLSASSLTVVGLSGNEPGVLWVSTSSSLPLLYVSTQGFTGINTALPQVPLHIISNHQTQVGLLVDGYDPSFDSIYVNSKGTGKPAYGYAKDGLLAMTYADTTGLHATVASDEKLTITADSKVGIKNTNPSYRLHVSSGDGETGTVFAVSTGPTNVFYVAGDGAHATSFWGDGSGLTGVTGASGTDSTKVLKAGDTMTGRLAAPDYTAVYGITASSAVFSSGITASSYTATGAGLSASRMLLADNVSISSETSSALGAGVRVSTNIYIVGFSSAARYYGDGSALTGTGDSLGSHIAAQDLQMSARNILNAGNIAASGSVTAARYEISGSSVLSFPGGSTNLAVGLNSGRVTTGTNNTFSGTDSGYNNTGGGYNSFFGNRVGLSNTFGNYNAFFGYQAGYNNTLAGQNSFFGMSSGYSNSTGENNVYLGYQAGLYTQTGSGNVIFGAQAGAGTSGNSFSSSTLVGYQAGFALRNGSADNIFLGYKAGSAVTTGAGNIIIGYGKGTSVPSASSELNIGGVLYGDLAAKTIGISTRVPQAALDIVSTGTASYVYAQIWRDSDGTIKSSMTATGVVMAARFVGDGSGLTGVSATDPFKLPLAGGAMTGQLTNTSSVTITGNSGIYGLQVSSNVSLAGSIYSANGNLGIGTANPNSLNAGTKLMISGINNPSLDMNSTDGSGYSLKMNMSGTLKGGVTVNSNDTYFDSENGSNIHLRATPGNGGNADLYLESGAAQVLTVKPAGRVGIGTTTPDQKLTVAGNISQTGVLIASGTGNNYFAGRIGISSSTAVYNLVVSSGAGETGTIMAVSTGSTNLFWVAGDGAHALKYYGDGSNLSNTNADMLDFLHASDLVRKSDNVAEYITGAKNFTSSLTVTGSAFSVGGSTLAVTAGRVGINTANPDYLLHVKTNSGSLFVSTEGTTGLGDFSGVGLDTNSVVHVVATLKNLSAGEDGRVGLFVDGRTSGGSTLDFLAAANFEVTSNGADSAYYLIAERAKIRREISGGGTVVNAIGLFVDDIQNDIGAGDITNTYAIFIGTQTGGTQTNAPYALYSADSNARAYFAGKVGIGAVNPGANLDIQSYTGAGEISIKGENFADAVTGRLSFSNAKIESGLGNTFDQGYLALFTKASGSGIAERVRISSAGLVGIGTTDPKAALDVVSTGTLASQYAQIWRSSDGSIVASMTATGQLSAGFLTDTSKVSKSGDSMLGDLSMSGKSIYFVSTITAIGDITAARYQINGSTVLAILPGIGSLAVGFNAGSVNSGTYNFFSGYSAGNSNTTGGYNTLIGAHAGYANTTGGDNTFVGSYSGKSNLTAYGNTLMGNFAGYNNRIGTANSIFGANAGQGIDSNSFSSSTIVGYMAGYGLTTGSDNILLGYNAGYAITTGTGNIIIGYNKSASASGANNELNIGGALYGNLASGNIGIGASNPAARLEVSGADPTLAINNTGAAISTLDFRYSGASQAYIRKLAGNGDFQINSGSSGGLTVLVGGSTRFFIQNDGIIGINTIAPTAARLHVLDDLEASGTGFGLSQLQTGVKGVSTATAAKTYKAGLAGYIGGAVTPTYAAGVLGAATDTNAPGTWGALGYMDGASKPWAGYFTGPVGVAKPAETSIAETLAEFTVSDNAVSRLRIANNTTAASMFVPLIEVKQNGSLEEALIVRTIVNNDSDGNSPMMVFDSNSGGAAVAYRSLFEIRNNNVPKVTVSSGGNVGIGITTPISTLQVNGDLGLGDVGGDKNAPIVIWLAASNNINVGDVVVANGTNQAATVSAASDTRVIGVAYESISASSWGRIVVGGVATVNCTAGAGGQHAVTSTTTGNVSGMTTPVAGTSVGVFLTPCGTPITGKARLLLK